MPSRTCTRNLCNQPCLFDVSYVSFKMGKRPNHKKRKKKKMGKSTLIAKHINEFNMFFNQLSLVKINFEDEVHALISLSSLSDS